METIARSIPEKKSLALPPCPSFNGFGPFRYFMAPMAGITDTVFRLLIREMGAEVVISELVSSEGLIRGGERTLELTRFDDRERPVGIQIFGHDVDSMVKASQIVENQGADFVDINFGCPVKKIVCDGSGAAWLRDPMAMSKLLNAVQKAIRIPLTIKIRTGWDYETRNAAEIIKVAAEAGVRWVAVHGRTRAQGYEGKADWDFIKALAQNSKIPVIGNGDILTAEEARQRIDGGYAHGVMIGRGALKNPWVFQELTGATSRTKSFLELIERHFQLAIEKKERRRAFLSLKKFMGWYAAGFPGSSQFRHRIFSTHDIEELKGITVDYFSTFAHTDYQVSRDAFLMGGHG